MMIFLWPKLLFLLLAEPLAVAAYFQLLKRKKMLASRYAGLPALKDAMIGTAPGMRRHIPPLLFLLALTIVAIATARPVAVMTVPTEQQTIILAIDTSISMGLEDIPPTRIAAAKDAARGFVNGQLNHIRVGVVSFAATASVAQAPTTQREDLLATIDRLELQHGTAVGSAILVSLQVIFPDLQFDLNTMDPRLTTLSGASLNAQGSNTPAGFRPVPAGSYTHAAIVLLTDGRSMVGPDPIEAARMAAEHGVRIFTVGIGAPSNETSSAAGWTAAMSFDEESLMEIADVTKGKYYYANNAADLTEICQLLNSRLVFEEKRTELTALLAVAAALLTALSGLISLFWTTRAS